MDCVDLVLCEKIDSLNNILTSIQTAQQNQFDNIQRLPYLIDFGIIAIYMFFSILFLRFIYNFFFGRL